MESEGGPRPSSVTQGKGEELNMGHRTAIEVDVNRDIHLVEDPVSKGRYYAWRGLSNECMNPKRQTET